MVREIETDFSLVGRFGPFWEVTVYRIDLLVDQNIRVDMSLARFI